MALNVNIIGKDSEGNLQALKVNSEGNLEISDSLGWGELLQDISDELELVKAELQTIKANQLSGDQKVQLSGTIDSLLYSLTSDQMINSDTIFWGENIATAGSVRSIDISGASQVVVVLENKHDVAVNVTFMYLTREAGQVLGAGYVNVVYREEKTTSIPAGASVYLDKEI